MVNGSGKVVYNADLTEESGFLNEDADFEIIDDDSESDEEELQGVDDILKDMDVKSPNQSESYGDRQELKQLLSNEGLDSTLATEIDF